MKAHPQTKADLAGIRQPLWTSRTAAATRSPKPETLAATP